MTAARGPSDRTVDSETGAAGLRIIVADDQAAVREGLVTILDLTPGITVVASAADGRQVLDLVDEHRPDAVLLDLHMPVLDGVRTAAVLTERHPDVAVVVLTTYADDGTILAALRAGARSYLTKNADRDAIAHTLRSAVAGLAVLDPRVQARLLAAAGSPVDAAERPATGAPPEPGLLAGLTVREGEILGLVAAGLSNSEIAADLVVSPHTVKTHLNHVFAKTGSRDRAAVVAYAYRHGLAPVVPPSPPGRSST